MAARRKRIKPTPRMLKAVREELLKHRSLPYMVYLRGSKTAVRKYCELLAQRLEHMAAADIEMVTERFIDVFMEIKKQERKLDRQGFILQLEEAFATELLRREASTLEEAAMALENRGEKKLAKLLRKAYEE